MSDFQPEDQSNDRDVICPHCGWSRPAEPCEGDASEDPSEQECDECGKVFILFASTSITYHTKAKEVKP